MQSGLSYHNSLDPSLSSLWGVWLVFIITIEISILNANSADPDQTPHSATFDLGLLCLPMSLLWDPKDKWVNPAIEALSGAMALCNNHLLYTQFGV